MLRKIIRIYCSRNDKRLQCYAVIIYQRDKYCLSNTWIFLVNIKRKPSKKTSKMKSSWKRVAVKDDKIENSFETKLSHLLHLFQLRKPEFLSCPNSNFLVEQFYEAVSSRLSFFSTIIYCILSFFW